MYSTILPRNMSDEEEERPEWDWLKKKKNSPCMHGSIDPKNNMCRDCHEIFD